MPSGLEPFFASCEIDRFSTATQTTAGIMGLNIDTESRVALTVLKKVFGQRGSARKVGALSRGLKPSDRPLVPAVLDELLYQGWVYKTMSGNNVLYVGAKERRKDALRVLDAPAEFKL